jgi:hypothetical protein
MAEASAFDPIGMYLISPNNTAIATDASAPTMQTNIIIRLGRVYCCESNGDSKMVCRVSRVFRRTKESTPRKEGTKANTSNCIGPFSVFVKHPIKRIQKAMENYK